MNLNQLGDKPPYYIYVNKEMLVVYNICGILHDNTERYAPYLESIVEQNYGKVVVSACMPNPRTVNYLKLLFPQVEFYQIDENLPVNVTFNKTVLESIKRWGNFDSYAYVSCDSYCQEAGQLEELHNILINTPNCGLVCPRLLRDSGYAFGCRLGQHRFDDFGAALQMFSCGDYTIPVGKAVNAHTLLYSGKIQEYYGKCCPDIFKGFCTESVLTFVAGAINLNWIISKEVCMGHDVGMDTPSAGQGVQEHSKTRPSHDHPLVGDSLMHIFDNPTYRSLGGGYEECQSVILHDQSQWDKNGHCVNSQLAEYIKENLYLSKEKLDYEKINGKWAA